MAPKKSFFSLAKRSFLFWFGAIWLFVGLPFLIAGIYIGMQNWQRQEQLTREGQVTTGTVLTKSKSTETSGSMRQGGRSTSTSYRVGYSFKTPGGKAVKFEQKINSRLWNRLEERGPIQITFYPAAQTSTASRARVRLDAADYFYNFGSGLCLDWWCYLFHGSHGDTAPARFDDEAKGMTVEGTVLEVAPTNFSLNDEPQWQIRYSYRDHKGKEHEAKSPHIPPEEAEAWKAGDKGSVRYDLRSPQKSVWLGTEE